ncbi:alpha/beta fold hydrolase [Glycomyces algeriensis]|uniref:Hydrolase n=1 Tax=Glycomyces algeriensis TaxID=256037 RepID=A0A9W6LIQ7_9ACTN|nr:alpha/beta hydrolase [Glycomyces algeriensis]MDA1365507.1 alpha/beta hydrolase [Glycomyces algeriensis]MDR7351193.1 pimeloyl-ACP methyl ester carboxylesterase [Glycomyces algeriensis]GLI43906.1 hydrolase [Glycomyces algeriensis]
MQQGTIDINGTAVEYTRRGEGPPLLLVPGGSGHGGVLERLAEGLAEHYAVAVMNSRVASRQRPGTVLGDQHPKVHAEDAAAVIDALFDEAPIVVGFSSGAVTTLELLAHHPERVRLAVVHEPPLVGQLPEAARLRAEMASVRESARAGDFAAAGAAMTAMMIDTDVRFAAPALRRFGSWPEGYAGTAPEPPTPELLELFGRLGDLQPLFLEHMLVQFTGYEPDLTALAAQSERLVLAVGVDSRADLPFQTTAALASHLGLPLAELPSGHLGSVERPTQFAGALRALLNATRNHVRSQ